MEKKIILLIVLGLLGLQTYVSAGYKNKYYCRSEKLNDELRAFSEQEAVQNRLLLKEIKKEKKELHDLMSDIKQTLLQQGGVQDSLLKKQESILGEIRKEKGFLRESCMADVFMSATRDVEWLKNKNFCPSGYAANFSYLYILFRFLNDLNPACILELGPGQTSFMLSQYVQYKNKNAKVITVEHNPEWVDFVRKNALVNDALQVLQIPLKEISYDDHTIRVYEDLAKNLIGLKFDLILVDGGDTSKSYSRMSVLDLIPQNLSNSFVIIIDDFNRQGEKNMAQKLLDKLEDAKIKCHAAVYRGLRQQLVIVSNDLIFLAHV
jgi:hypothetical protein